MHIGIDESDNRGLAPTVAQRHVALLFETGRFGGHNVDRAAASADMDKPCRNKFRLAVIMHGMAAFMSAALLHPALDLGQGAFWGESSGWAQVICNLDGICEDCE
jgi:hypothetical protein